MRQWLNRFRPSREEHPIATASLPFDALETVRLAASRRVSTTETGAHLRRRKGQSLEFRDHRSFVPGDDIRHLDWRVSARIGGPEEFYVRQFDTEDRLSVGIVIDLGPTQRHPVSAPKVAIAALASRAFLWCAERGRDLANVICFDGLHIQSSAAFKGRGLLSRGEAWLLGQLNGDKPQTDEATGIRQNPPGVLIILSDFYSDDADGVLIGLAQRVQRRFGIVVAIQLDSWDLETGAFEDQPVAFDAIGDTEARPDIQDPEPDRIDMGRSAAETHVTARLNDLDFGGLRRYCWRLNQTTVDDPAQWLAERIAEAPHLANALAAGQS